MSDQLRRARLLRAAVQRDGPVEPTDDDWQEWLALARSERALPLLHHVASGTSSILSEPYRLMARDAQLEVMGMLVRFEVDLLRISEVLGQAGVRCAVLKGAATAHLDHVDPSYRQFGDIDLLVSPTDLSMALTALNDIGWSVAYQLPRNHEAFTHAITLRSGGRLELDLHQRLGHRALGRLVPTDELLDRAVPYVIAEHQLLALDPVDRLINAAVHLQSSRGGYRRLSSCADVLVMSLRAVDGPDDLSADALCRAESWRLRSLVESAVIAAFAEAQLPLPAQWKAAFSRRIATRDRLVDLAYLSTHRRPLVEEAAHLRVLPSWRDRATYLAGYFATDPDYAAQKGRHGPIRQIRYLARRAGNRSP